jgi:type II secretion system protein C
MLSMYASMTAFISAIGALLWISLFAPAAEKTSGLVLDGVIVAENPADSVALVRRAEAGRAQILRVGQELQGYVLVEVAKGSVRLRGRDSEVRLVLAGAPPAPVPAEPEPPKAGGDSEWIRRAFPREVARARLEKEIPVILSETDLTPRVEEGEVRGLSVARLPDGTLLSESGLLPGDLLVSINGEPLVGVEALWELIARLVDQDEIRIVVRRRGEVLKLAYDFTQ